MWARRCGAKPLWPSRVKVLIQSFMTAALGMAIYSFMVSVDTGYLDVTAPVNPDVLCLTEWPLKHESQTNWFQVNLLVDAATYRLNMPEYVAEHQCTDTSLPVEPLCTDAFFPLTSLDRSLGVPLGHEGYTLNNDFLEIYGFFVLWLTALLWIYVVVHDMALLSTERNRILDFQGLQDEFPCIAKLYNLSGFRHWRRLVRGKGLKLAGRQRLVKQGPILAWLFLPFVIIYNMIIFLLIITQVSCIAFLCYPIRLSRVLVFIMCLIFSVVGIWLSIHTMVLLGNADLRQAYAITWQEGLQDPGCVCGCLYPVKSGKLWSILVIAVVMTYKALTLAFKCLKGLRRSNWASLLSVMFPVPLTVYNVEWTQPDGLPIQHRQKGEPVQAEPAFDPFALMDEQPESGWTTTSLMPVPMSVATEARVHSGPTAKPRPEEYIGCCGFPCRKRKPKEEKRDEDMQGVIGPEVAVSAAEAPAQGSAPQRVEEL